MLTLGFRIKRTNSRHTHTWPTGEVCFELRGQNCRCKEIAIGLLILLSVNPHRDENHWVALPGLLDSCCYQLSGMQFCTTIVKLGDDLDK